MKVKEVMTVHPEMISANELINAAHRMRELNVGLFLSLRKINWQV